METKNEKLFLFVLGRQSNKGLNQYHPHGVHPKGNGLGPVHSNTGPVEMLPSVQKQYKTGHVAESQRVQCSCALDQALPHPKFYACVLALMFALEMSFAEIIVEGHHFTLWTH